MATLSRPCECPARTFPGDAYSMSNAFPIYPHATQVEAPPSLGGSAFRDSVCDAVSADRGRGVAVVKRTMDVVGSAFALVFLMPILLLIAALIRLDSSGPALFRQRRLGRGGRTFWCLKFRTMTVDAEQRLAELETLNESGGGVLFKIRQDPRVTRIGRLLRKTSLDELPQFFNVLKGEMALVGPRPLQLRDCELLEAMDPEGFRRRLERPPGAYRRLAGRRPERAGLRRDDAAGSRLRRPLVDRPRHPHPLPDRPRRPRRPGRLLRGRPRPGERISDHASIKVADPRRVRTATLTKSCRSGH